MSKAQANPTAPTTTKDLTPPPATNSQTTAGDKDLTPPPATDKDPELNSSTPELQDTAKGGQALNMPAPRETKPEEEARWRAKDITLHCQQIAHQFAMSVLSNPNAERFLYGNPLEAARLCGDEKVRVGAFLAMRCHTLAQDFMHASGEIERAEQERLYQQKLDELLAEPTNTAKA